MIFLGKQEFPGELIANKATQNSVSVINKLNIPLHKDVDNISFGDLFSESNIIKYVDDNLNINSILDLNNDDVVKSLLLSELLFDNFFNYDESYTHTHSFNTQLDVTAGITQRILDITTDLTTFIDSTTGEIGIIFLFDNLNDLMSNYNTIRYYISNSLPLYTLAINLVSNIRIEKNILFKNVTFDATSLIVEINGADIE